MKKAKFNVKVDYIEIQTPKSAEALDMAFNILFEEVMNERKDNHKNIDSDQTLSPLSV
jgi:hypothetical protein